MNTEISLIGFLGAIAIFLYGIRISRMGLQLWGGDRLRGIITSLTENRFMGLGVGVLVTLILQSSSATVNMLVSFAGAGMMGLSQAMGVLLGADIGTTFVVVLFSIRQFSQYALLILVLGVLIEMGSKTKKTRYISMVLIGFGFIFFGLHLMVDQAMLLKNSKLFLEIIQFLSQNALYSLILAALFTPFLSSAGTIGLIIAFAFSGVLTFEQALPYILGANLGTCFTSLASSFSGSSTGKQVAVAHLLFKFVGVLLFFPFISTFAIGIENLSVFLPGLASSVAGKIALAHMSFNLILSILFLPFIKQGVWLVQKLVPPSRDELENKFSPRYLDAQSLTTPSLAFANVKRELLRVADWVYEMFRDCIRCYEKSDPDWVDKIESLDESVDLLDREIKLFLAKLSQENLTSEQAKLSLDLISAAGVLEEIGDIVVQNVLDMAGKKIHRGREFSEEGWKEIRTYHAKILQTFAWAISALTAENQELAHKVTRNIDHLSYEQEELRNKHLARLQSGLKESFETSSIHLDTLSAFSRVAVLLGVLVRPLLDKKT